MKQFLIALAIVSVAIAASTINRKKRAAYELPDGIEYYLPPVVESFVCQSDGYFADVANNCNIFHVCITRNYPDGNSEMDQYSFACGNQTVFDQFSMTCAHPDEAIPCSSAADFFYLNQMLGLPNQPIHTEEEVSRRASYFDNRL